jgi:dipeptidyl aminopeptidase/acylaminoacyl peptidase
MVILSMALLGLADSVSAGSQAVDNRCRSELVATSTATAQSRTVSPADLARLRDFGKQDVGLAGEAPFSISPDHRSVALVLRRGDPARDDYCIGLVVVPLDGSGKARLVDAGGDFILEVSDVRGIPDLPIGNAKPVTPHWSPDGGSLAYLRRDNGLTRVWVARADGTGARPVSKLGVDARDVRWSGDGRSLIVTVRPGVAAGEAAIDAEERRGFLYDRRFWTLSRSRPAPPTPIPFVEQRIDATDGHAIGPATAPDGSPLDKPAGSIAYARSSSGARAWTSARDPKVLLGPVALHVEVAGRSFSCAWRECSDGVGALWWGSGGELFFMQGATPENGGVTRLLRWRVGETERPRLVLATLDALFGCGPVGNFIVCAREASTQPRELVRVDPQTGMISTIYDPNPEFASLIKGGVQRLRWRLGNRVASYGDLVLPPGHKPGDRHPLVLVQYQSRGFLRGGTGDEYPIQALAAHGFAVLSIERTRPVAAGIAGTPAQLMRISTVGFAERRRVQSSLEAGVRKAIATGVVDPERIGITGLSDGAATVQYALVNSNLFKVAAISSCCDEPSSSMFAAGPGYADFLMSAGFPAPGSDGSEFWRHYSLAANAKRIRTPILMQVTDDEFRFSLATFVTLKVQHVPVEMYVFANEYHQKWRPAHRLATYVRAIDWFDFWFNKRIDPDLAKKAQYDRWRALARLRNH